MHPETFPTAHYEAFAKQIVKDLPYGARTEGLVSLTYRDDLIAQKSYHCASTISKILCMWNKVYRIAGRNNVDIHFEWGGRGILSGQKQSLRIAYKSLIGVL